ncbi:MAG: hypothetical protein ACOYBM_06520 [Dethiobacteria bacterium]|jgi:hypothetical protein|nr:hypothetical protein [Bacillota bacterium]
METRQQVEESIKYCRLSAKNLRSAAQTVQNAQAKNAFEESARKIEDCIQQCQTALNQL